MKLSTLLKEKERTLSFEVFPPKTSDRMETVLEATEKIAALQPDFMSVTYGAGGGTSQFTVDIAARLQEEYGTTVLPHLTCVSSDQDHVKRMIHVYEEKGLENYGSHRIDTYKYIITCDKCGYVNKYRRKSKIVTNILANPKHSGCTCGVCNGRSFTVKCA